MDGQGLTEEAKVCIETSRMHDEAFNVSVDSILAEFTRDEIIWAARPSLSGHLQALAGLRSSTPREPGVAERIGGRWAQDGMSGLLRAATRQVQSRLERDFETQLRSRYSFDDGVLRHWGSENTRLAVGGHESDSLIRWMAPKQGFAEAIEGNARTGVELLAAAFDADPSPMIRRVATVHWQREVVKALMAVVRPRVFVTSNPGNAADRLFISQSRRLGIPSVYIPHAPVTTARGYLDLSVDLALLRGEGERDYYAWSGAHPECLEVTGDPTWDPPTARTWSGGSIVVFATTAHRSDDVLSGRLEMAMRALAPEQTLIVAAHPVDRARAGRVASRLGLDLWRDRTNRLLSSGDVVAMLSERSSGVELEAAWLGIPTASLSDKYHYVFQCDLGIPRLHEKKHLRAWLASLNNQHLQTMPWLGAASRWVAGTGPTARNEIETILHSALASGRPVLDWYGHFA